MFQGVFVQGCLIEVPFQIGIVSYVTCATTSSRNMTTRLLVCTATDSPSGSHKEEPFASWRSLVGCLALFLVARTKIDEPVACTSVVVWYYSEAVLLVTLEPYDGAYTSYIASKADIAFHVAADTVFPHPPLLRTPRPTRHTQTTIFLSLSLVPWAVIMEEPQTQRVSRTMSVKSRAAVNTVEELKARFANLQSRLTQVTEVVSSESSTVQVSSASAGVFVLGEEGEERGRSEHCWFFMVFGLKFALMGICAAAVYRSRANRPMNRHNGQHRTPHRPHISRDGGLLFNTRTLLLDDIGNDRTSWPLTFCNEWRTAFLV